VDTRNTRLADELASSFIALPRSSISSSGHAAAENTARRMHPFLKLSEAQFVSIEIANDGECLTNLRSFSGCRDASTKLIKICDDEISIAIGSSAALRCPPASWLDSNPNECRQDISCQYLVGVHPQVQLVEMSQTTTCTLNKTVDEIPRMQSQLCERCRELKTPVKPNPLWQ